MIDKLLGTRDNFFLGFSLGIVAVLRCYIYIGNCFQLVQIYAVMLLILKQAKELLVLTLLLIFES